MEMQRFFHAIFLPHAAQNLSFSGSQYVIFMPTAGFSNVVASMSLGKREKGDGKGGTAQIE